MNSNLIYEGVYKEEKKWNGKLKEYDSTSGVLIFDVEIKEGEKEGNAIKHDFMSNLIFEGIWKKIEWKI